MPGRALRVAGIAKCKTLMYVGIISTKGSTAQQKQTLLILETAGSEIQSRRRRCKLSLASISNQVNHALAKVTWNKEQIEEYQAKQGVASVKKSLRPGGDPTQPLPVILSINTRRTYFQAATLFFKRAEEITDEGLLAKLLDPDILRTTFEEHYTDAAPGTVNKLLAALEKVHLGCTKLGWTKEPCPITPELRDWVKSFRDDSDVRSPRFGYKPEDAEKVVSYLKEKKSAYALPAELALRCGLREDEIAGLKGENIDGDQQLLHITGKGGRYRPVPIPENLLNQLNSSKQYLFTPNASWRAGFRRTVRDATKALGIEISGVHRLRANFAQNKYQDFLAQGMDEREARRRVSELLGHARIDVTYKYVPKGFVMDMS
jgi:integrase